MELLEQRLAPATYNVLSTADGPATAPVTMTAPGVFSAPSLRAAIQAANATITGDVINLAVPGTYKITRAGTPGETDNLAGEFAILASGGDLTIGNGSGGTVIVDGGGLNNRVFDINPGGSAVAADTVDVVMHDFTIQHGLAQPGDTLAGSGGGIRDQGNVNLTLTNMVVTENTASADGGGLVMGNTTNASWTLTVNASTISNNHAGDAGGGIDTDGTGTVFINAGTVVTGNTDLNQGAGVYIDAIQVGQTFESANMVMTGTVVSNNAALAAGITASGGGISNAGTGNIVINNSTVAGNFSGGMGGGFSDENNVGTLSITDSLFLNNSATMDGGGIQEGGPSTTITNSLIRGNSSGAAGGGVFANGTTLMILSSTVANNRSVGSGGGLEVETTGTGADTSIINNSTIANNSALNNAGGNAGGGIDAAAAFTGALVLLNDTVNGNFADNGGGVFWAGTTGSSVIVQATILARNNATTGPDVNNPAGTITDVGGNLVGVSGAGGGNTGFTDPTTQTGTVANPLDPLLGPLQNNGGPTVGAANGVPLTTEAPLPGSPAVDRAGGGLGVDERGFPRPDDNGVGPEGDIGAFEFQNVAFSVTVKPSAATVFVGGAETFTVTVTNTSGNALPADNSTVVVTLPAGLTAGGAVSFALGALAAGQSQTFTVTAAAAATGAKTVTATVTSPDANPNSVSKSTPVTVLPPPPPPSISVAIGPIGQVLLLVSPNGIVTQFDATGAHVMGAGVRSAGVAFSPIGEVLVEVLQNGLLYQFDASGVHLLGANIQSAGVAFGTAGEVLEVVNTNGVLYQFDATGTHVLAGNVRSASVAIGPAGQVLEIVNVNGVLVQADATGTHVLLSGVVSAGMAYDPSGAQVFDVIFQDGSLFQLDSAGAHFLAQVF